MNKNTSQPPAVRESWRRMWERFWFTPADPTLLGMIRIGTGLIALYLLVIYSFQLQDVMGPNAWVDLKLREDQIHNRPFVLPPLLGPKYETVGAAVPTNDIEANYIVQYQNKWGDLPPPPFPVDDKESQEIDAYRQAWGVDLRVYGLRPPKNEEETAYLLRYTMENRTPPPSYPKTKEEAQEIDEFIARQRSDPRRLYVRGITIFSLWLHVTEPTAMAIMHGLAVTTAFLFTIGFCTRVSSVLLWFFMLCYIHRNSQIQFGLDAMMSILLLYMAIGPTGSALSVDRLLARWWSHAKPDVIRRWYRLLGRPEPAAEDIAPAAYSPQPVPSISANVALRLLQLHVCIIYLAAGLSKLYGHAWWDGTAIWGTLANPEFAPFQVSLYDKLLRWLASTSLPLYALLNIGTLFTLTFEIGYAFLIWRPTTRWVFLSAALLLHGLIGVLMGLKEFGLIMLVMNMAFLTPQEAKWLLSWFTPSSTPSTPPPPARSPTPASAPASPVLATSVTAKR
jgi:hypothetical protein